jgi:hypothetical protein
LQAFRYPIERYSKKLSCFGPGGTGGAAERSSKDGFRCRGGRLARWATANSPSATIRLQMA